MLYKLIYRSMNKDIHSTPFYRLSTIMSPKFIIVTIYLIQFKLVYVVLGKLGFKNLITSTILLLKPKIFWWYIIRLLLLYNCCWELFIYNRNTDTAILVVRTSDLRKSSQSLMVVYHKKTPLLVTCGLQCLLDVRVTPTFVLLWSSTVSCRPTEKGAWLFHLLEPVIHSGFHHKPIYLH